MKVTKNRTDFFVNAFLVFLMDHRLLRAFEFDDVGGDAAADDDLMMED